jgi:hypothetical protein
VPLLRNSSNLLTYSYEERPCTPAGYAAGNPILLKGLKKGDLIWMEMVLGPVNISDSGDAVVLIGFH